MNDPIQEGLIREINEELREDRMKAIWSRYRVLIIGAAVALVVGVAGFEGWKAYTSNQRDEASETLTSADALVETDALQATDIYRRLGESGPEGFATLARLRAAALLTDSGDHTAARAQYEQIRTQATSPIYGDLAALLEAQSLLIDPATADPESLDAAQALLTPLLTGANPWWHSARELEAVIALRNGDREKARETFASLMGSASTPAGVRMRATAMHAQLNDDN